MCLAEPLGHFPNFLWRQVNDLSQATKSKNLPLERWFVPSRDPDGLLARRHTSWEVLRQSRQAGKKVRFKMSSEGAALDLYQYTIFFAPF